MVMPAAVRQEAKIGEEVRAVEAELKPDVVRIRWDIKQDWRDEWAIFFRIVLSDDAVQYRRHEVANQVRRRLDERLDFAELGVFAYHHFRSQSEQAGLREEAWA
jgi:hypothetical protein